MTATAREIVLTSDGLELPGTLRIPSPCAGSVVFAHGSGSSRLSPRNRAVASYLVARGCATLLFDLLTPDEAADRGNVFDIALLAQRLRDATVWLRGRGGELSSLPVGLFGASTGAAAAIVAAAGAGRDIAAVVSRGGRPDLAGGSLPNVTAPTLLLVGSLDTEVLELNRAAQTLMHCENHLHVVPGASHLFEELGTLEIVAQQAAAWFVEHFERSSADDGG
jgi:putative phosphoribosyl transferase